MHAVGTVLHQTGLLPTRRTRDVGLRKALGQVSWVAEGDLKIITVTPLADVSQLSRNSPWSFFWVHLGCNPSVHLGCNPSCSNKTVLLPLSLSLHSLLSTLSLSPSLSALCSLLSALCSLLSPPLSLSLSLFCLSSLSLCLSLSDSLVFLSVTLRPCLSLSLSHHVSLFLFLSISLGGQLN